MQKKPSRIVLAATIFILPVGGFFLYQHFFNENNNSFVSAELLNKKAAAEDKNIALAATLAENASASTISQTQTKSASSGKVIYVSPQGKDSSDGKTTNTPLGTIQKAIDMAQAGYVINLADGIYLQDFVSKRNGNKEEPITITGSANAVVKGGGKGRVIEINHDNIILKGFTVDGLYGSASKAEGYRDKLIYVLGKEVKNGVSGLRIQNMTIKNAGGECIRLRYFAQNNEISNNTITSCGVVDFSFDGGGKNGEAIYIGTAPEQRKDGKNPTADPDLSNSNWIHDNVIDTQGNECVDIKESSSENLIENNKCTGQKDSESGGMDSRGNGNVFRKNTIAGNSGAGIRFGGDTQSDGINNIAYENTITNNKNGGIKIQQAPQAKICGNVFSNNDGGIFVGKYASKVSLVAQCK